MVKRSDYISKGRRTGAVIWYEEVSYQVAKSMEATRAIRDLARGTPVRWSKNQLEAVCEQLERESQAIEDAYAQQIDRDQFTLPLGPGADES